MNIKTVVSMRRNKESDKAATTWATTWRCEQVDHARKQHFNDKREDELKKKELGELKKTVIAGKENWRPQADFYQMYGDIVR